MSPRRAIAIGAFAFRSNARSRMTRAGVAGGLLILLMGPVASLATGRGWELDPALAFYGLLVMLIFGLRSGLGSHRDGDFDVFLTQNMATPTEYAIGLIASLLATWAIIVLGTFLALIGASGGDVSSAAWYASSWGARSAVLIGLIPLMERVATFRMPFVLPALGYFTTLILLSVVLGEVRARELLITVQREDPGTLLALIGQALVVTCLGFATFVVVEVVRGHRVRSRRDLVPVGHGDAPPET